MEDFIRSSGLDTYDDPVHRQVKCTKLSAYKTPPNVLKVLCRLVAGWCRRVDDVGSGQRSEERV